MSTGKTAFQKIVDSHLLRQLSDGRMVLKLDWVWAHEITTPNAILDMTARDIAAVFNPNKIKTMIDHVNPAKDTATAIQGKMMRDWSRIQGIEFLDVGRTAFATRSFRKKAGSRPGKSVSWATHIPARIAPSALLLPASAQPIWKMASSPASGFVRRRK